MRHLTIAVLAFAALSSASAASAADLDYDVLRGADYEPEAAPLIDWSGAYIGGHGGYSSTAYGFKSVYHDLFYNQLHDTTADTVLGISSLLRAEPKRAEGGSFGIYAGYNVQLDELVIGFEADYTHFGKIGQSGDDQGRSKVTDAGLFETVHAYGNSSTKLEDFGTLRARVGYAIDKFLPFVTGGLAIGRAQVVDNVSYRDYGFDQVSAQAGKPNYANFGYAIGAFDYTNPYSAVGVRQFIPTAIKTKTVAGAAFGAGFEYAITSNILLRGEYQYVLFNDFDGHQANMNTVRAGAALKF